MNFYFVVDSTKEMIGTFSPQQEPYTHEMPEETTPSGMFARGSYSARSKVSSTIVICCLLSFPYDTSQSCLYKLSTNMITDYTFFDAIKAYESCMVMPSLFYIYEKPSQEFYAKLKEKSLLQGRVEL